MQIKNVHRISAVSYANTYPFLYGLMQKMDAESIEISQDVPAICAKKLSEGQVDIGLIPVAKLGDIPNGRIISDYCIGAVGAVKTVLLMSQVPLDLISEVYLDPESRTSVNLVKVLAKLYWKKSWEWKTTVLDFPDVKKQKTIVLIGDKTSDYISDYPYIYDLADSWLAFTGKPFVFAAWVANRALSDDFVRDFNKALSFGLHNIDAALDVYANASQKEELSDYLNNYISYDLDDSKREGMELFLNYLKMI